MTLKTSLILMGGLIIIAVGYYFISPFFSNVTLDEAAPIAIIEPSQTTLEANALPVERNLQPETIIEKSVAATDSTNQVPQSSPEPIQSLASSVIGTKGHPASGTARIVTTINGTVVRFENFKTINGPDLFVYLASDLEATDFIDLGQLKATEGNINYEVPREADIKKYPYVLVWCKQFGVLFNYARINT